jgi:hypothetical protein
MILAARHIVLGEEGASPALHARLDVSLKTNSVCVPGPEGAVHKEGKAASMLADITHLLQSKGQRLLRGQPFWW